MVLPDPRDAAQWQKWTAEIGWQVITLDVDLRTDADTCALNLADKVRAAIKANTADPDRIYLAGRGEDAGLIFYIVSRIPDIWAAALALGGSPKPAVNAGRLFGANFTNTPVIWVSDGAGDGELAARLKSAGFIVDWHDAKGVSIGGMFQELLKHSHSDFPPTVDCETASAKFAGCYWMQPVKFDPAERNETLPGTRVLDGSGASLDFGGFGYKLTDSGPGVLISYLPKDYEGLLKLNDRIVELDGQPIADARDFDARLNHLYAEKLMVATIQRGKERLRFDTRVILPRPDALTTARVQGRYDAGEKTVRIISRAVIEMRLNIPEQWIPSDLYWNGVELQNLAKSGCYLLTVDKELLNAAPCP